jgi:hypothetical protein
MSEPFNQGPPGSGAPQHHSGWIVTSQLTDQVIVNDAGKAITGVQIFFITGNGNEGSVFIANNHYTPKVVKPAIHAAAAQIDTIGQLSSAPQ